VIIVIAGINFTNFTTALSPMRIKNINTQRVLGLQQRTIRWLIVSEAVFFSLSSFLVALFLMMLLQITPLTGLVDVDLSLVSHPAIVGCTALVALLAGTIAGAYPSRYMTSFAPALVLKGSFGLSPKGKKLRNTLISIQFVASFALIIGASFMYLQNKFIQKSPLGYDKENLVAVDIRRIRENRDAYTNQIKTHAGVEDVTYSTVLLSSARAEGYDRWGISYRGEVIWVRVIPAHYTFLDVMGIEITEGRSFRQEDGHSNQGAWVFNESARQQFNLEMNSSFAEWPGGEIIGFIPDIKYASFHTAVEPMGFFVPGTGNRLNTANFAYIKLNKGTNIRAAISHIHASLAEFDASYPFEVHFFDEVLQRLYETETSLSLLISLFSLLAIFISIVGVFGLVVFDSECRRKEIGIRKVLGASTIGIIIMFNKAYFKLLVICFVIAAPLAWYAVTRWLENFAYKTPMYWWVYLLAFVAVAVITACTVTLQNWRVANDDPVKAIKSE
jgi:putative ABC transport system permease protein